MSGGDWYIRVNQSLEAALIQLSVKLISEVGSELAKLAVAYLRSLTFNAPDDSFLRVSRETIIAGIERTNPGMPGEFKRSLAFDAIKLLAADTGVQISDRYVNQLIEAAVEAETPR